MKIESVTGCTCDSLTVDDVETVDMDNEAIRNIIKKLIDRELIRLELSLKNGVEKYGTDKEIIMFMHYPPITKAKILSGEEMQFIDLMKKYNVKRCYYGHLHGASIKDAIEGEVEGIQFKLISADGLDFKLEKIK